MSLFVATLATIIALAALFSLGVSFALKLSGGPAFSSLGPGASLANLAPAARARVLWALAWFPFGLATAMVLLALSAPFVGQDHCESHADGHVHLCLEHGLLQAPPLLWLLATVGSLRLAWAARSAFRSLRSSRQASAALRGVARRQGDLYVVESEDLDAFVLGLWAPDLFVSAALLQRTEAGAVLAHERAHRRRRDPLRAWLAAFGMAFHLPSVGRQLASALRQSHEMAADAAAAVEVGSIELAQALVRISRLRHRAPSSAAAMTGGDLEARIRLLLSPPERTLNPSAFHLGGACVFLLGFLAAAIEPLHHIVETLMDLLGS